MRRWRAAAGLAFVAAVAARAAGGGPDLAAAEREIVARSNAFRASHGVAALGVDAKLGAAARQLAAHMASTDRYGHEADGRTPAQRAQAQGYAWCKVAENIAMQYSSAGFESAELAQRFTQGWIESPGHRRNLLDRAATEIGVAIAHSERSGRYYAAQVFGRPAALTLRFEISNRSARDLHYRLGDMDHTLASGATRRHQQCSADPIEIELPGRGPTRLQPADGGRYRIEGSGNTLRLVGG